MLASYCRLSVMVMANTIYIYLNVVGVVQNIYLWVMGFNPFSFLLSENAIDIRDNLLKITRCGRDTFGSMSSVSYKSHIIVYTCGN